MNPQKKALQLELAKEIMLAEISGRRANGQAGGMNYFDLFDEALTQAIDIADKIEKDVTNNLIAWEAEQRGNINENEQSRVES